MTWIKENWYSLKFWLHVLILFFVIIPVGASMGIWPFLLAWASLITGYSIHKYRDHALEVFKE